MVGRLSIVVFVCVSLAGCSSESDRRGRVGSEVGKADDPNGSCSSSCGGQSNSGTCWCDDSCAQYGDCCTDKLAVCDGVATCIGACGGASEDGSCYCDDQCVQFGDCCDDKANVCDEPDPAPEPDPEPDPEPASCAGACGEQSDDGCWCDESCAQYGDCCPDKADECPDHVSFSEVYGDILSVECAPCHTEQSAGALSMATESIAFSELVGEATDTLQCSGRTRVVPGNAASSVLFQKVSGLNLCGPQMPLNQAPLSDAQVNLIGTWIADGANP